MGGAGFVPLRQHRRGHTTRGGFADRAGNRHHRAAELVAVAASQIQQRLPGILNIQRWDRIQLLLPVAHHRHRPVFNGLGDKIVAVKPFTLDGKKQAFRPNLTCILGN